MSDLSYFFDDVRYLKKVLTACNLNPDDKGLDGKIRVEGREEGDREGEEERREGRDEERGGEGRG